MTPEDFLVADFKEQYAQSRHLDTLQERYTFYFVLLTSTVMTITFIYGHHLSFVLYILLSILGIWILAISIHIRDTQLRIAEYMWRIIFYFHRAAQKSMPEIADILDYGVLDVDLISSLRAKENKLVNTWTSPHFRATKVLFFLIVFNSILIALATSSTISYVDYVVHFVVDWAFLPFLAISWVASFIVSFVGLYLFFKGRMLYLQKKAQNEIIDKTRRIKEQRVERSEDKGANGKVGTE